MFSIKFLLELFIEEENDWFVYAEFLSEYDCKEAVKLLKRLNINKKFKIELNYTIPDEKKYITLYEANTADDLNRTFN